MEKLSKNQLVEKMLKMECGEVYEVSVYKESDTLVYITMITKTRWFNNNCYIIGGLSDNMTMTDNINLLDKEELEQELSNVLDNHFKNWGSKFSIEKTYNLMIKSSIEKYKTIENFKYQTYKTLPSIKILRLEDLYDNCEDKNSETIVDTFIEKLLLESKNNSNIVISEDKDELFIKNNFDVFKLANDTELQTIKTNDIYFEYIEEYLDSFDGGEWKEYKGLKQIGISDAIEKLQDKIKNNDDFVINYITSIFTKDSLNIYEYIRKLINLQIKDILMEKANDIQKLSLEFNSDEFNW